MSYRGFRSTKRSVFVLVCSIFLWQLFFLLLGQPCLGTRMGTEPEKSAIPSPQELSLDTLQADPKASLLALAEKRLEQGLWQESLRYARAVTTLDGQNTEAHGILGTLYALTGQTKMAQEELSYVKETKEAGQVFYRSLIQAVLKAQEGEYREAEGLLGSALEKDPGHPVAVYYSGSLNLAQNKLEEAEKAFKKVVAGQPDFTPALAGLGQVYLRRKNMKEAAAYYERAIANQPENLMYRRQLVNIYKATGQKEAANRQMTEALYYLPGIRQSYLTRGMQLLSEGSYVEAIKEMDKVIGIYKNIPEAYYVKAAAQINLKETSPAQENIKTFVAQQWGSPQAHHYAGMCYLALGDIKMAEAQLKTVISLNPNMGRSFVPLTIIEQLKGNYDWALEGLRLARAGGEPAELVDYLAAHILLARGNTKGYLQSMKGATGLIPGLHAEAAFLVPKEGERERFTRERNLMVLYFFNGWYGFTINSSTILLGLDTKDRFAWHYKGLAEIAHKETKSAIESFNQLLRIDPELYSAHMNVGRLYMQTSDFKKAEAAFTKVIELQPAYAPARVALGDLYVQTKEEKQAIQTYEKALELDPSSPGVHQKLAMILSEKPEKLDEALAHATEAEKLDPDNPFTLDVLGWIYVQKGETEKGIEKLKEAVAKAPQNPVFQYHLGVAHYKNDDLQQARQALNTALSISKEFPGAEQAREISEKISK